MQTLVEETKTFTLIPVANHSSSSSIEAVATTTLISMKGYDKATFIVTTGSMTEATMNLKAYQAKSVSGSSVSSTALTIDHFYTDRANVSTHAMVKTSTTSNGVTMTSVNNATYIFDVDAKQLTGNSSYDCIGLVQAGVSAAATYGVIAILHKARYQRDAASMLAPLSN